MSREQNRRNHYRLLQVQPDAPPEVIKASYRTLMQKLKYHPDLGGCEWNAALINEAYAVLSNPEKREAYDREQGRLEKSVGPSARATSQPHPEPPKPESTKAPKPASPESAESRVCAFCKTKNSDSYQCANEVCSGCGGPLRLVDFTAVNASERAARRIEHQADIHYQVNSSRPGSIPGRVVDLSPTGLRFLSRQRLTPGCVIKIDSPTLSAVASVTHSKAENPSGFFSTGVRFLTLRLLRSRGTFFSESA